MGLHRDDRDIDAYRQLLLLAAYEHTKTGGLSGYFYDVINLSLVWLAALAGGDPGYHPALA